MVEPRRVLVVGTGLVGTSLALALSAAGDAVSLSDPDPRALALAVALGAGTPALDGAADVVDVVVVAAPPDATAAAVVAALGAHPRATVTDVASVKAPVAAQVAAALGEAGATHAARYVGGHPMAGRERSGPGAASADLFLGRPWVLCPGPRAQSGRVEQVAALAARAGAQVTVMDAGEHDAAVAVVSHLPQVAASLVAARLVHADPAVLALSGQGLRDTTRVAASDPALWTAVLAANAAPVRAALQGLRDDVETMITALGQAAATPGDAIGQDAGARGARAQLSALLTCGRAGAARIPGKHGRPARAWAVVTVLVADAPGELARLFADVGAAGVNLEELRLDHSPGRALGLAEVSVDPARAGDLLAALERCGWAVHPG